MVEFVRGGFRSAAHLFPWTLDALRASAPALPGPELLVRHLAGGLPRMKPRHGRSSFVHFRTDSDMVRELDELVSKMRSEGIKGVSRSSVARTLIKNALKNPTTLSEVREVLAVVWMVVQKTLGRVTGEIESALPKYLEQSYLELAEKSGDAQPAEPR
jgi:hypothetical protein